VRTKNARAHDDIEAAYLADCKRIPCVVCNAPPPGEAHHPEQGLHLCGIGCCKDCHGGPGHPHGWHGDKSRWRAAKMTPMRAINETRRRIELLREGRAMPLAAIAPRMSKQLAKPTADGAIPRYVARPWVK
jgi:hypothetical protein